MKLTYLIAVLFFQLLSFTSKAQDMDNFEVTYYIKAVNSGYHDDAEAVLLDLAYMPFNFDTDPVQSGNEWVYHYDRKSEFEEGKRDDLFMVTDNDNKITRIQVKSPGVMLISECKALLGYNKITIISRQDDYNFTFKVSGYNNLLQIKYDEYSNGQIFCTLTVYR